jgi:hypothetical protein
MQWQLQKESEWKEKNGDWEPEDIGVVNKPKYMYMYIQLWSLKFSFLPLYSSFVCHTISVSYYHIFPLVNEYSI